VCGIFGYIGEKDVVEVLVAGLKRLQYRGYDSCGIAVLDGNELAIVKEAGRIERLEQVLSRYTFQAKVGIAHTRWATHGTPTPANAHPHIDCQGSVSIVHNGVIDNFLPLRESLLQRGHILRSETDTEVIAHLIEEELEKLKDFDDKAFAFLHAVRNAVRQLKGSYAIACLWEGAPGVIVAARQGSPLLIGVGSNEACVGSDLNAILPITKQVILLNDGELALVTQTQVRLVFTASICLNATCAYRRTPKLLRSSDTVNRFWSRTLSSSPSANRGKLLILWLASAKPAAASFRF